MRRLLPIVAAAFLLSALPVQAQWVAPENGGSIWPFACQPKCGVEGWLDEPKSGATIGVGTVLAGWGFERVSGHKLDRVDVWYEVADEKWVSVKQPEWAFWPSLYRPDVSDWFRASKVAPTATEFSGWHLTLVNPPPAGARRIRLNLWYGPYMRYIIRTFNVSPDRP